MSEDEIFIQCYRMSSTDFADLTDWLSATEGVEETFEVCHRAAPGTVDFNTLGVKVVEFFAL